MVMVECCDLCFNDGKISEATAHYYPEKAISWVAICDEHHQIVKEAGLDIIDIL
jgi:hypothetical protein